MMSNPFNEGAQAYLDGLQLADCPYPDDSEERIEWEGAYMEAEENDGGEIDD